MSPRQKQKHRKNRQAQKQRRQELIQRLKPLIFALLLWVALSAIIELPPFKEKVYSFFLHFTTHAAYWFSRLIFMPLEMPEVPFLSARGFRMQVVMECTAYNFYLFAISLVIFARWPLRHKFTSLGIFLLAIFVLNNLRFVTMGYLGSYRPELFDPVHDIVWDVLFGFAVFGLWAWRETTAKTTGSVPANKPTQTGSEKTVTS